MAMRLMNVHSSISLWVKQFSCLRYHSFMERNSVSHWEASSDNLSVQTNVLKAKGKVTCLAQECEGQVLKLYINMAEGSCCQIAHFRDPFTFNVLRLIIQKICQKKNNLLLTGKIIKLSILARYSRSSIEIDKNITMIGTNPVD